MICHWARDKNGMTFLIPGCLSRVHDPDAPCTCRDWTAETAGETIRGLQRHIHAVRHENQLLRAALRRAGVKDPTAPVDWKAETARQRRRTMHRIINGEDV